MSEEQVATENQWFYEENGQRKGPILENEFVKFIKASTVSQGTPVWKQGFPDWMKLENTELRGHLNTHLPPPLSGEHISNSVVWVLAFAPFIGYFMEWIVAGALSGGNEVVAQIAMDGSKYWFVTLALNIALSIFDEKRLRKAGHNTDKFKGMVWLVPVYLYQRAKATKQSLAYFIVWIVCFVLVLLA
ncbi:DUF4339 domain-containing protein [Stenotrophomonas sp. YIM B06876]|uniref:DUF4339 domain-containing protein n=1 Tax=Stenotrophomonas sp. YIM B06876 TaxID=3060211 RepID=UPI00273A47B3|nr:DUF4339 domain-containing protein [Stenotrophomonas sp. YIM B06876]